ncbi:hypothetical protein B0T24DRAFT_671732 [Lasiosphaeria ovina]|uniref:Dipeptidylpeptidase IV N-terminal domain-containing protein n=1 Tax=Lasiosphaeria ovina TaxID=92902 RepID=A0AAE0MXQ1_9PEZI|nr:hypothetical protein B0T24DRAFT_671732 [Lasiosphaeria ovina]
MPADGLTKKLSRQRLEHFRAMSNLQDAHLVVTYPKLDRNREVDTSLVPDLLSTRDAGLDEPLGALESLEKLLGESSAYAIERPWLFLLASQPLGSKSSGRSRSGHLDLSLYLVLTKAARYLIANAMQAFTCQPLTRQARENPFTDSALLASLDVASGETQSLVPGSAGDMQYAQWSPVSSSQIAFVQGNNLFI